MRRTKIVATIGPASRDPRRSRGWSQAGIDVARLELLARQPRAPRRERRAGAGRRGRGRPSGRDPPGPARPEAADRRAARTASSSSSPASSSCCVCGSTEDGRRAADVGQLGGARRRRRPRATSIYLADGAIRLRVDRDPRGRRRGRDRGRDRRLGRLAPGPQHPGLDARAWRPCPRRTSSMLRFGESIGVDVVALSFVAHRRGRHERAPAHPPAADRQDREAPGGRRRRGDHPRRRLRDGGPRRPRDRAADRGRPDRPEAPAADRRQARPPVDHRRRRCSTRWSPPRARPAPRRPTSPTRSSTAPTP